MADKEKRTGEPMKSQYIDVKGIMTVPVIVSLLVIAFLSFLSVKLIADAVKVSEEETLSSGKSILGSSDYVFGSHANPEVEDMVGLSESLSRLASTHTEWTNYDKDPKQKGFFCIATESSDRRLVYNLDPDNLCGQGYKLQDFEYLWVDSVNSSFYAVINIPGEIVDLSDYYILVHNDSGNLASRLVINCYEAKAVRLNHAIFTGTLLAPKANVEYEDTSVYGQVYAVASTGNRAYYKNIPFGGYSEIMDDAVPVEFLNVAIRSTVVNWLKAKYPETYAEYPDSYVPTSSDLALVTELILDDLLIADMGDDLACFVNLEKLSCVRTKLTELDVSGLKKLAELDISETKIASLTLPEGNVLRTLRADDTALSSLPTEFLTGLKTLSIAGAPLASRPDYSRLTSLKSLDISGTGFDAFRTEEIAALAGLEELSLSENPGVTSFRLADFPKLKKADLSYCSLTEIDLKGCDALSELNVSYNKLKTVDLRPAASLTLCEAFGDGYSEIIATGSEVRVNCNQTTTVTR